jgi:hypothetical protein
VANGSLGTAQLTEKGRLSISGKFDSLSDLAFVEMRVSVAYSAKSSILFKRSNKYKREESRLRLV